MPNDSRGDSIDAGQDIGIGGRYPNDRMQRMDAKIAKNAEIAKEDKFNPSNFAIWFCSIEILWKKNL